MKANVFWALIDSSIKASGGLGLGGGAAGSEAQLRSLGRALGRLSSDDLIEFNEQYWRCHASAYRWDLWAVAYLIHGGCSDDGFHDCRTWFISMGRQVFEDVMRDPDSLADVLGSINPPFMLEGGISEVVGDVYEALTDEYLPVAVATDSEQPAGEDFDFDDDREMQRRFPRIFEKVR